MPSSKTYCTGRLCDNIRHFPYNILGYYKDYPTSWFIPTVFHRCRRLRHNANKHLCFKMNFNDKASMFAFEIFKTIVLPEWNIGIEKSCLPMTLLWLFVSTAPNYHNLELVMVQRTSQSRNVLCTCLKGWFMNFECTMKGRLFDGFIKESYFTPAYKHCLLIYIACRNSMFYYKTEHNRYISDYSLTAEILLIDFNDTKT